MLPEVEQLFIWLTYSTEFDLLDHIGLEDLNHLDDQERLAAGLKQSCSNGIFHEIKPIIYKNTERTPGRARYTKERSSDNYDIHFSNITKHDDVESMIIGMRLDSGKMIQIYCNTRYVQLLFYQRELGICGNTTRIKQKISLHERLTQNQLRRSSTYLNLLWETISFLKMLEMYGTYLT